MKSEYLEQCFSSVILALVPFLPASRDNNFTHIQKDFAWWQINSYRQVVWTFIQQQLSGMHIAQLCPVECTERNSCCDCWNKQMGGGDKTVKISSWNSLAGKNILVGNSPPQNIIFFKKKTWLFSVGILPIWVTYSDCSIFHFVITRMFLTFEQSNMALETTTF